MPVDVEKYIVIDMEWTVGDRGSVRRPIEFAAILVDAKTFRTEREYSTLINPGIAIPGHIQRLTGIKDKDVIAAPTWPAASKTLIAIIGKANFDVHKSRVCSWGTSDRFVMRDANKRNGVKAIPTRHYDLRWRFSYAQRLRAQYSLERAAMEARVKRVGKAHRALSDARLAAALLPFIFGGKKIERIPKS